jgi:hypothetical protein
MRKANAMGTKSTMTIAILVDGTILVRVRGGLVSLNLRCRLQWGVQTGRVCVRISWGGGEVFPFIRAWLLLWGSGGDKSDSEEKEE